MSTTSQFLTKQCYTVSENSELDLAVFDDTAKPFAQAKISAKSRAYAKILLHMNTGPRLVRIMKKGGGVKNLVTLSRDLQYTFISFKTLTEKKEPYNKEVIFRSFVLCCSVEHWEKYRVWHFESSNGSLRHTHPGHINSTHTHTHTHTRGT